MVRILFTANIQRHIPCPEIDADGATLREVLENAFKQNAQARSYVFDDQAALRKHMTVFIDGHTLRDRVRLSDPVTPSSVVYIFQALSGG